MELREHIKTAADCLTLAWLFLATILTFIMCAVFVADAFVGWGETPDALDYIYVGASVQAIIAFSTIIKRRMREWD